MIMISEKIIKNAQNILILIENGIITKEEVKEILGLIEKENKDDKN